MQHKSQTVPYMGNKRNKQLNTNHNVTKNSKRQYRSHEYGQNGFIGQSVSSETYKELGKDKVKELGLPILGNIKHFDNNNDAAGTTNVAGAIDPEEDDLPF